MFKLDASASIRALENGKQDFFKDQAPWPIAILGGWAFVDAGSRASFPVF
jgi:hypothetical protein